MTYRLAAEQIVSVLEAIAVSDLESECVGNVGFSHNKKIGDDYVGGDRQFNLFGSSGSQDARRNGRIVDDVEIMVDYITHANKYDLDITIRSDFAAIVSALKDTNNWGRPASTIDVIFPADEAMFPYVIEELEDEKERSARRLVISIAIQHLAIGAN